MKKHFYQLGKQVLSLSAVIAGTMLFSNQVSAQGVSINGIGTGTAPDASAILDLNVSGITPKKGFLAPRVALTGSADATTITSPATSLIVYNTATGGGVSPGFYYNSGTPGAPSWVSIGGSGSAPTAGNDIDVSGTQVDVEPILNYVNTIYPTDGAGTGAASDLTINLPLFKNLIFQTTGIEVARLASTGFLGIGDATPASLFSVGSGDLFQVNSSGNLIAINGLTGYSWPAAHASGVLRNNGTGTLTWGAPTITGVAPLTNGTIWIGNGSSIATEQTMSGDVTMTNAGVTTIQDNAVDGTDISISGESATNTALQYNNGTGNWVAVDPASTYVTSFSAINTGLTPNSATTGAVTLAGTLDVDNGGTGTSTAFTPGSVVFAGASGIYTQDNPNFFWDNTNDRLGIGAAAAPAYKLDVNGTIRTGQNGLDGQLLIYSEQGGTDYTYTINPNAAATQNVVLTLPVDDGTANQVLATDGSGALSWATQFVNPMTTWGDIIYGGQTTAGVPTRLGAGTAGMTFHTNGVGAAPSWSVIDLDNSPNAEVGGILGVGNGGTGVANPTAGSILVGNGTNAVSLLAGTDAQTIRFNGTTPTANSNLLNNGTNIGIGIPVGDFTTTDAILDIIGSNTLLGTGDSVALSLRMGDGQNLPSDVSQITFGYNGTKNYRHAIKTRHNSTVGTANAIDFYVWKPGVDAAGSIGTNRVFTIFNNGTSSGVELYGGIYTNASWGTSGQVLASGGAGVAPTWVNAATGTVTSVTGTDPIFVATGTTTPVISIQGQAADKGGVLYSTGAGTSADFVASPTATGQILRGTAAGGAPTWSTATYPTTTTSGYVLYSSANNVVGETTVASLIADLTVQNGLYLSAGTTYDGSSAVTIKQGGALTENTVITQGSFSYSLSGNTINLNDAAGASATNIGTGTTTGTVTIGGTGAQTISIGNGAAAKTVNLGSSNTTSTTTILSGSGAVNINAATSQPTNINSTAGNTGNVVIGNANNFVGIGGAVNASYKLTITGKVKSTGINETSDARLKMNFASIDGALNKVLSMNGKYYDWRTTEFPDKGLSEGRQIGVIAQEIEKILPEVVTTGDDGYKAVEYSHIVPVLIEAIKDQQKIIDGQNSTITDLKASLENVLNRVNIIEKNTDFNSSKVEK